MSFFSRVYLLFLILGVLTPIGFLFVQALTSGTITDQESWQFLVDHRLIDLLKNTTLLSLVTVSLSCLFGFFQALIVSFTNVNFKKVFHILFVLPIVYPLYVLSYIYVGSFEFSGEIPTFFREFFHIDLTELLPIKSLLGVSLVFSLALSPYVYLFVSSGFLRMDKKWILSAQALGRSPGFILYHLILPYSRPWLYSAGILVFLEVLCDFGGVSVFNYDTFSTAVYQAWISWFSINTAIKLSSLPLLLALLLYTAHYWFQRNFF